MNRLPTLRSRLPRALPILTTRAFQTSPLVRYAAPAGNVERPELASDQNRTAQSPKSKDEKILDRAQEAEKDKAPFTEKEEKEKNLDEQENTAKGAKETGGYNY